MKKIIILLGISLGSLFAQSGTDVTGTSSGGDGFSKAGSAGGQFLKIGPGARANAMGGAATAVVNDLSAIHWNPAGVAAIDDIQVYVSYTSWFADYQQNYAAIAAPINDDFTVSVFFLSFGVNDIPVTTINRPDGTGSNYSVNDVMFGAGFHGNLTEQFSFGINAKYVQNAFETVSAGGFAFDIGTMYDTNIEGIKLGFSIHNLSAERTYSGTALQVQTNQIDNVKSPDNGGTQSDLAVVVPAWPFSLPLIFRAGLSKDIIDSEKHYLLASADFVTMSDAPEQFALGAEYTWNDILSLRGGYYYGNDQLGLSGGAGIKYLSGDFDGTLEYSANPTNNFGFIHRLNVIMDF
ncbi:PorV/PorQ family protein [Candidatus Kapabacteria bacterium]|nr:PorV/PorQ family protein [Candidatus Kapabacteria bacterium]